MMAGNPSWWNMHSNLRSSTPSDHHHQANGSPNLLLSQTQPSASLLPVHYPHDHHGQDSPHSWSQLLLGGLASEQEERFGLNLFQSTRVMSTSLTDVKQEMATPNHHHNNNNNLYGYHQEQEAGVSNRLAAWSQNMPASSPKSCVTSLNSINNNNNNNNSNNNTMLDFSTNNRSLHDDSHQHVDHSNSECNSNMTGGASNKKPKVQSIATPPLKVRKEKLGDRITALHQLVSPFGKTDTASVLLEAIGYIRFLQGQIEALSSPYLGNNNASAKNQHSVHCERNCLFPDHPGQLLNDSCLKTRATTIQEEYKDAQRDLKSRGLCLVPLSCTQIVGNDNGADYWAPSFGGGF